MTIWVPPSKWAFFLRKRYSSEPYLSKPSRGPPFKFDTLRSPNCVWGGQATPAGLRLGHRGALMNIMISIHKLHIMHMLHNPCTYYIQYIHIILHVLPVYVVYTSVYIYIYIHICRHARFVSFSNPVCGNHHGKVSHIDPPLPWAILSVETTTERFHILTHLYGRVYFVSLSHSAHGRHNGKVSHIDKIIIHWVGQSPLESRSGAPGGCTGSIKRFPKRLKLFPWWPVYGATARTK